MDHASESRPPRTTRWLAPLVVLTVAAALRVHHLGTQSLWLDEATSVYTASKGPAAVIARAQRVPMPPLYELILSFWVRIAGHSEFAVRLPSAVFSTLACLWAYLLGRDMAGPRVGFMAGILQALAYYPIRYAQEARCYALLLCLATASMLAMWRALQSGSRRSWLALGLANILLIYTHVFAQLIFFAQNVIFLTWWLRRRRCGKRWIAVQAATALAFLPWAFVLVATLLRAGRALTVPLADLETLWETLCHFLPLHMGQKRALPLACLCVAVILWGLWRSVGRDRPTSDDGGPSRTQVLLLWCLLPPLLTFTVSKLYRPVFMPRYLITVAPAVSLLLALGLDRLGRRLAPIAFVILCIGGLSGARTYHEDMHKEQWRELVAHIDSECRPGDVLVFTATFCHRPLDHYSRRTEAELPRIPVRRRASREDVELMLADRVRGYRRAWVFISHAEGNPLDEIFEKAPWAQLIGRPPKTIGIYAYLYELNVPPSDTEAAP
ncbi:glycosyltransferase family 39 protein [bacterium]|nr:glycosyltransferase family 39 protein [bacterium]